MLAERGRMGYAPTPVPEKNIPPGQAMRVQIHGNEPVVDAILKLHRAATGRGSMRTVLDAMCEQMATIADSDVVSVYVVDETDDGSLVMRGNYGFRPEVVGTVRLKAGEGMTGFAAECQRPVSAEAAPTHARFKLVPGLNEERFPALVAVPLVADGRAHGVLVLQRKVTRSFDDEDLALATALSAAFTLAIEWHRERHPTDSRGGARSVRLDGTGRLPGEAFGPAAVLPSFRSLVEPRAKEGAAAEAEQAFLAVRELLEHAIPRAPSAEVIRWMLADSRLRSEIQDACAEHGIVAGLREVARRYALTPHQVGLHDDDQAAWLAKRATDVEDLCLFVACAATSHVAIPPGSVLLLPERLTTIGALYAVARRASAVVLSGPLDADSPALRVLADAMLPLVTDISGLFAWAGADDRIYVDGTAGRIRLNPTAGEVVALRQTRFRNRRRLRAGRGSGKHSRSPG